ncbi:MAG: aldolase [Phycisphaerae bacterium]|nr:aldolase [Phycisphaerae bacterium]
MRESANVNQTFRMNRLFAADGKCFDVAIDHGFFNERSFLPGIEDMSAAIERVVDAAPDAVQLSPGLAPLLQARPGAKPALVLRTDAANVYGRPLPAALFSRLVEDAVDTAVRLDAACVVVNILMLPDHPELHDACVANVTRLRSACDRAAMPLMVEPLVMRGSDSDGYGVDGDPQKIVPLVRQAVELGADIIKADPTESIDDYEQVIRVACGVPVLVRGGGRAPDEDIFRRTHAVMQRGARGIVYGRNVIQHASPARMTRALMAIVHEGATASDAITILRESRQ